MNWKRMLVSVALSACWPGIFCQLHAWQSPPDEDASEDEVIEYYQQAYGEKHQMQSLNSLQMKWNVQYSEPTDTSRYPVGSMLGQTEIIWTPAKWAARNWFQPDNREGLGLYDDGQKMYLRSTGDPSVLGERARLGNHRYTFVKQGALPAALWSRIHQDFKLAGVTDVQGKPAWKLEYRQNLSGLTLYIDRESGLAVRLEDMRYNASSEEVTSAWTFQDHREVKGILVPHQIKFVSTFFEKPFEWTLIDISMNQPVDESAFEAPEVRDRK